MSSPSLSVSSHSRIAKAIEYLQDLWQRREFALALGLGNLKARNASTSLGLFWWVLNPILLGAVYFVIFGVLFGGRRPDDFLPYLLSGMFAFHFTAQSMTGGANSIIQNGKLLANLRFPRLILPISTLIESLVGFVASLLVLLPIVVISGIFLEIDFLTYRIVYLPFIIVVHLVFNLGLSGIAARLAVPFRDINNLLPYINRIWLYITPIIWPLTFMELVNPTIQTLIRINPMFHIVGLYRSAFLGYTVVGEQIITSVVWAAVIGVLGVALFIRQEGHMVRYL